MALMMRVERGLYMVYQQGKRSILARIIKWNGTLGFTPACGLRLGSGCGFVADLMGYEGLGSSISYETMEDQCIPFKCGFVLCVSDFMLRAG